jgi:hypothetical protein
MAGSASRQRTARRQCRHGVIFENFIWCAGCDPARERSLRFRSRINVMGAGPADDLSYPSWTSENGARLDQPDSGVQPGSLVHGPWGGEHVHSHAAGSGPDDDGDGIHSHSHSHQGDGFHDHPHSGGEEGSVYAQAGQAAGDADYDAVSSSGRDLGAIARHDAAWLRQRVGIAPTLTLDEKLAATETRLEQWRERRDAAWQDHRDLAGLAPHGELAQAWMLPPDQQQAVRAAHAARQRALRCDREVDDIALYLAVLERQWDDIRRPDLNVRPGPENTSADDIVIRGSRSMGMSASAFSGRVADPDGNEPVRGFQYARERVAELPERLAPAEPSRGFQLPGPDDPRER